jgi:Tol biopolymer transport system component
VSANGIVAQRHRTAGVRGLTWLDRDGRRIGQVPVAPARYGDISLAADDRRIALTRATAEGSADVWSIDAVTGITTRLSFDVAFAEKPIWSPDGRWITFSGIAGSARNLYRRQASGGADPEMILKGRSFFTNPLSWTPDGGTLVIRDLDPRTGEDVWRLSVADGRLEPVLRSTSHEEDANLSPDGRWMALRSNESGRAEVYVHSFPIPDQKYRVSTEGGGSQSRSSFGRAFWRQDGRELVYVGGDGITVRTVAIEAVGGVLRVGAPQPLFRLPAAWAEFAPTSDLRRFLVLEELSTKESGTIQLIANWPTALNGR